MEGKCKKCQKYYEDLIMVRLTKEIGNSFGERETYLCDDCCDELNNIFDSFINDF